jgi:MFS family permease
MTKTMHGTLVWLIVTIFVVYGFCLNTASGVFSESIKNSFHSDSIGVSLATSAFVLGYAIMQIPAGHLLDNFNTRFVVSGGALLLLFGNIIISFSPNITIFAISNFLQGTGAAFSFVGAAVLISQWFPAKYFPILFGLTQAAACIFAGIIHYYFTITLSTHSWNDIYRVLSMFGLALFIFSLLFINSPIRNTAKIPVAFFKSLKAVLYNKQIMLCSLAAATSFGVLLSYASLWYLPVQIYHGIGSLDSVIISGTIFLGVGIGSPLLGWISNTVKSRVMVIHVTLALGIMTLLLGLYLPSFNIETLLISKIIAFFTGFFLSGSMLFYTMISEFSTDNIRGVAISVLNTIVFLFNTLMLFIPFLFVTVASKDYFTYLWVLPFLITFSLLILYFIKDSYPGNKENQI